MPSEEEGDGKKEEAEEDDDDDARFPNQAWEAESESGSDSGPKGPVCCRGVSK